MVNGRAHLRLLDVSHQPGDSLTHGQALAATANVLALQRHHHHLGRHNHTGVKQLQHHPIPGLAGLAIQRVRAVVQLTRGRAQADGAVGEALLDLGGDLVDVQVRGDESSDQHRGNTYVGQRLVQLSRGAGHADSPWSTGSGSVEEVQ
ncbi:hypothetical protein D3C84_907850 [compost metagenome]